jgi:hypothetical protein
MTFLRCNGTLWGALLVLLTTPTADGFTVPVKQTAPPSFLTSSHGPGRKLSTPLFLSDEKEDLVTITSVNKKEIAYDEKTGRFYETKIDGECLPEEGEYCAVDSETGELISLTVEEKERIFLDSLQSYYISGRQLLDDAEFDLLKEDLQWNGSPVVALNRDEAKYLAAVQAYLKGDPIMNDAEFDALKKQLKDDGSQFAVSKEPKCYIDTGICTVTFQEDRFRSNLLYLPVGLALFIGWLGFGYEIIGALVKINPLILILLGAYPIYTGSVAITEGFIFENKKIAYGPCPSCEAPNRVYFGNILGVEGYGDVADVKCSNCKAEFKIQRKSLRASTVPKN